MVRVSVSRGSRKRERFRDRHLVHKNLRLRQRLFRDAWRVWMIVASGVFVVTATSAVLRRKRGSKRRWSFRRLPGR